MINVTQEQAKAIVDLTEKIENIMTQNHILVAIPIDGVPVLHGIVYILFEKGAIDSSEKMFSFLAASSKHKFVDKYRLNELKKLNHPAIFIDWRTVSGELGKMLKKNYQDCIYAVLSDPNNKADIRATQNDIPKFEFPKDYKKTLKTIGLQIEPNALDELIKLTLSGDKIKYSKISTEQSRTFYNRLYEKIDEVLAQR